MKIKYSKTNLLTHLATSVILTGMSLYMISMFYGIEIIISLMWLVLGIYTLHKYYEKNKNGYLKITEKSFIIYENNIKTIEFKNINRIRKFAGDITVKHNGNKTIINTGIIDSESLKTLNSFIEEEFENTTANNGYA